jgi:capsular polysaccharide biosynthesis protein
LALGLVLSIAAGLGAAMLRDSLDASVRGAQDIRALLSVPPLVAIPIIATQAEQRGTNGWFDIPGREPS